MKNLALSVKQVLQEKDTLPFSVYSSVKEQHIFNVPVIKPLLICVLDGCKKIGRENEITCTAGNFIFLSNSPNVEMRNIPDGREYFALLIEFDFKDFACLSSRKTGKETFFQGRIDAMLQQTLRQFVEWSAFAPADMWSVRRQEILQLISHLGYEQVNAIAESLSLSHKLHNIISADIANDLNAAVLSSRLAMSESTLRRKLNTEGTSLQAIKDKAKLAHGLHLVQTSLEPIGRIAGQCGYQSQSRFTDKFKQLFGITPTELRKTKMHD
ncbi:AraC family transcriptional regulator [Chromatiaceae bacterium AAb-1]|nr:AraC family transcriptional regulator [Chromatiaceae bacterium AAb-1]